MGASAQLHHRHDLITRVDQLLDKLREVAQDPSANLMPATIEAVKAHASMGEIVNTLEGVFGRYTESPVF